ncbi:MAG: hypothetical protein IJE00_08020 [Clostridia bacterium]|nr:hypothetical protein [Clostridia bacterium]
MKHSVDVYLEGLSTEELQIILHRAEEWPAEVLDTVRRILSARTEKGYRPYGFTELAAAARPPCLKGAGNRRLTGGYCRFAADRPTGDYPSTA